MSWTSSVYGQVLRLHYLVLLMHPNAHPFSRESPPLLEFSTIVSEKPRIFNYKHLIHFQNRLDTRTLLESAPYSFIQFFHVVNKY